MPNRILPAITAVAALGFALAAAPAYAQDSMSEDKAAVMDAAEETMESAEEVMEAAEELNAPDTTAEPVMADDAMMGGEATMKDGTVKPVTTMDGKDAVMSTPISETPAPAPTQAQTAPVSCPSGTTAQSNGTCMVTGDWKG